MSESSDNQDPEDPALADDATLEVRLAEGELVAEEAGDVVEVPVPRKSLPPPGALLIPMPKTTSRIPPPPSQDGAEAAPVIPPAPAGPRLEPPTDPSAGLEPVSATRSSTADDDGQTPRSGPPPKPFSRPPLKPPSFPAPPPELKPEKPPVILPEPSLPPSMPTSARLKEAAASIRPARMIKLGEDSPRSSRPSPPVERITSSRPEAEESPPPLPPMGLPSPPAMVEDLQTLPRQPLPTPPETDLDEEEVAEVAPDSDEPDLLAIAPPTRPPKRPPPRAAKSADATDEVKLDVGPEETPTPVAAAVTAAPFPAMPAAPATVPAEPPAAADSDEAPDSGEDRLSIDEAEPVSAKGPPVPPPRAPMQTLDEGAGDKASAKKPPPPPKRQKTPSLPGAGDEAPRTETPSQQRTKRWWEELFTEDFARSLFPLTPKQVRREVDFIEESLGVAKGGVVLDLGCGAGHHAVELSSRGYGVVGLDLSLLQLMIAADNAQERSQKINFLQADMRDMSFESVFDGVYSWDTSFGYFEEDKNAAVIERVFRALRPGGNFLLDVINRDFVTEHQPSQVWFEGDACVCMDDMSVDFITSRLRVKRTMMMDDGRSRELVYSMRIYSLHELGKMLHAAGFRVIEASGHLAYPGTFLGATSPRVMILAQKP